MYDISHPLILSADLSQSCLPPYSMKSIKPTQTDPTRPKRVRKPAARKPPVNNSDPSAEQPPSMKRKKTQSKEGASLPKMACIACGATEVPLVMGGRECSLLFLISYYWLTRVHVGYCKPCVAPNNITTEAQPHNGTFIHKFSATPQPEQVCLFILNLIQCQRGCCRCF